MYTKKPNKSFYFLAAICTLAATIATFVFLSTKYLHLMQDTKDDISKNNYQASSATKLVCYYATPGVNASYPLRLSQVDGELCTHINLGMSSIAGNSSIILSEDFKQVLTHEVPNFRKEHEKTKLLIWVGGGGISGDDNGFSKMIVKHETRKKFIKSLKEILHTYELDGIDLDWEFPSAYNKDRTHFSQLLYELREEFKREKRNYLISIAVAAVEGIALFAYDIREINLYADYVNMMTYDYHFFSKDTPFTGINAPLNARDNEHSILATLNINYSINWWLSNGLERQKLVVGLPTYGHTFTLVNPFNNGIEAPAEGYGSCGQLGFATYSEICWFLTHNVGIKTMFDSQAASPYISSGSEWISFENETSIAIKTKFIRAFNVGGVMAYSLNADDVDGYCLTNGRKHVSKKANFPLISTIRENLFL